MTGKVMTRAEARKKCLSTSWKSTPAELREGSANLVTLDRTQGEETDPFDWWVCPVPKFAKSFRGPAVSSGGGGCGGMPVESTGRGTRGFED